MEISRTRLPKEVIILISELSELAEDNAADKQVNELKRGMRASESVKYSSSPFHNNLPGLVSTPPRTLHTGPWLGVPRQDHLHGDGAAPGGINEMFWNFMLTFVL